MISAILMASGSSKRLGENKLHIKKDGEILYRHAIDLLGAYEFKDTIVVTNDREVESYARGYGYKVLENKNAEVGKSSSIVIGTREISEDAEGIMYFVADMPRLSPKTVREIIREFEKDPTKITYPMYGKRRGAPMIFPIKYREELLKLKGDEGGVVLIDSSNSRAIKIDRPWEHEDVDLPSDIKKTVLVRGSGDLATGVITTLHRSGFLVVATDIAHPTSIRRTVSLSEAIYDGHQEVEGVHARKVENIKEMEEAFREKIVPILVDENLEILREFKPDFLVDAIIAKKNLGTKIGMAKKGVIALGPGFVAAMDADIVIETSRGHDLGRLIFKGSAKPNSGRPGNIDGHTFDRLIKSPADGKFEAKLEIGSIVKSGDVLGYVEGIEVKSKLEGVVRGLIRNGSEVFEGMKIGDVDPREDTDYMTISDKARNIAGSVLEAILILDQKRETN